jgi:phage terminase large subunit GpA-like protein
VRWLIMDDLDRFPTQVGDEGDPVELARSRVKAFMRHKLLFASTPTIKSVSLIERGYNESDMRTYHVACPHCGEMQTLKWSNVKANPQLTEAFYVCENGCIIEEHHKPEMLKEKGYRGKAEWIAEHPERKIRGYHISALYAPIGLGPSWLELVIHFKRIHKDPVQLKSFINQNLGEAWEDQNEKLKSNELAKRAGEYAQGIIPPGCLALSLGIDTQDKWLALTLLGWGANGKHWIIDWLEITGDTTNAQVWNELESYIHKPLINSYGKEMRIRAAGIDSRGHRTAQVIDFVMRTTLRIPVYSIQGATNRIGRAIAQSGSYPTKDWAGRVIKRGYCVWNVGTEYCKDFIFAHLAADTDLSPSERAFYFPHGLPDEYFDGVLSEVYDPESKRYVPRLGAKYKRNEPLDTLVYALAIGQHKDINIGRGRAGRPDPKYWERMAAMLEPADAHAAQTDISQEVQTSALAQTETIPAPVRNRPRVVSKQVKHYV